MAALPWFALRCVGDPALRVTRFFRDELNVETYYPAVREMRAVPRRQLSHAQRNSGNAIMRARCAPFIPGVVFTRMEPGYPRQEEIFERTKILGFICVGEHAAVIGAAVIDELRAREVNGAISGRTPARMLFRIGERVRVSDGPFTTFTGLVVEVPDIALEDIDADTRLRLTLDIFGRATKVELSAWQIEKL
jgi:transcription antitermination factor NusG